MIKINSEIHDFNKILKIYIQHAFGENAPVILCIGTDRATGDSMAPLVGTLLKDELNIKTYVYGTLQNVVNAKNVTEVYNEIKNLHPNKKILCIDACMGNLSEVGFVRFSKGSLFPGSATNKNLGGFGDYSILGIVDELNANKFSIFKTRLNNVYNLSKKLSIALKNAIG